MPETSNVPRTTTEKTFSQRAAASGAVALRSVRTGTGPCLFGSAVVGLYSAPAAIMGGLVTGMGTMFGAFFYSSFGIKLLGD